MINTGQALETKTVAAQSVLCSVHITDPCFDLCIVYMVGLHAESAL